MEEQLKQKRTRQKYYYDKHSKSLPELNIVDCVRIQSDGKWRPATVTSIPSAPRSYVVTTPEGQTYRRNRRHISKAKHTHNGKTTTSSMMRMMTGREKRTTVQMSPQLPIPPQTPQLTVKLQIPLRLLILLLVVNP